MIVSMLISIDLKLDLSKSHYSIHQTKQLKYSHSIQSRNKSLIFQSIFGYFLQLPLCSFLMILQIYDDHPLSLFLSEKSLNKRVFPLIIIFTLNFIIFLAQNTFLFVLYGHNISTSLWIPFNSSKQIIKIMFDGYSFSFMRIDMGNMKMQYFFR